MTSDIDTRIEQATAAIHAATSVLERNEMIRLYDALVVEKYHPAETGA